MIAEGNPYSSYVERSPRGRRLVVADIHGCARTFETLLDTVGLRPEDQLFLLGDYIDRGPDNGGVLNKIMQLLDNGYWVYPLRGNHEQYLLEAAVSYAPKDLKRYVVEYNASNGLLDEKDQIIPRFKQFLESLPFFYELKDFYLVHAGFNFKSPAPFHDYRSMLEIRNFRATPTQTGNKRIVHGHQVTALGEIEMNLDQGNVIIPLDNGCYFAQVGEKFLRSGNVIVGNLCCLDLDSLLLTVQPNVDYQ